MNLLDSFKPITTLIFDIDGVLTDGSVMVFETGEQVRQMNVRDGYALQLAVKKKYNIVVISGGNGLGAPLRDSSVSALRSLRGRGRHAKAACVSIHPHVCRAADYPKTRIGERREVLGSTVGGRIVPDDYLPRCV